MLKKALIVTTLAAVAILTPAGHAEARPSPKACLRALDSAEEVIDRSADTISEVGTFFTEIGESATRNATGTIAATTLFIQEMTASVTSLREKIVEATPAVSMARDDYDRYAAKCRSRS